MDTSMYAEMAELEESHWWFLGRRKVVLDMLRRYVPRDGVLLDVGLGTGYNAKMFVEEGYDVEGLEPAPEGIAFARTRVPDIRIHQSFFPCADLPKEQYSSVVLLDTIEHIENDAAVLQEISRVLKKGGVALMTVPAFPFLWTTHDERAHHFRRYRKEELKRIIRAAGLEIVLISHYNFFLFIPIALIRVITKMRGDRGGNDFKKTPRFLNAFLASVFGFERFLLRSMPLPFGVSLIAVVRKPNI